MSTKTYAPPTVYVRLILDDGSVFRCTGEGEGETLEMIRKAGNSVVLRQIATSDEDYERSIVEAVKAVAERKP